MRNLLSVFSIFLFFTISIATSVATFGFELSVEKTKNGFLIENLEAITIKEVSFSIGKTEYISGEKHEPDTTFDWRFFYSKEIDSLRSSENIELLLSEFKNTEGFTPPENFDNFHFSATAKCDKTESDVCHFQFNFK